MPPSSGRFIFKTGRFIPHIWRKDIPGVRFLNPRLPFLTRDPWNRLIKKSVIDQIPIPFGDESKDLKWNPSPPPNWKDTIHYFNFIHSLTNEEKNSLCNEWLNNTRRYKLPAWDSYAVARRVVNWAAAEVMDNLLLESLYNQVLYLRKSTDSSIRNFIAKWKALIFCGFFFDQKKWIDTSKGVLTKNIPSIINEDGGLKSKSISEHFIVLQDLLDIINIYPDRDEFRSMLRRHISSMLRFASYLSDQNGTNHIIGNSVSDFPASYQELSSYAANLGFRVNDFPKGLFVFGKTGFFGIKDSILSFVINGGGKAEKSGHRDLFTYELSVKGESFITDSGGDSADMSGYFKKTASHNTVTIDDLDQSPGESIIENIFEGGRRLFFHCGSLKVSSDEGPDDIKTFFYSGVFKGFTKTAGGQLSHKREIYYDDTVSLITVKDKISGSGKHKAKSFIHLHPDVIIRENGNRIMLKKGNAIMVIGSEAEYKIEEGWYSTSSGGKKSTKVIVYQADVPCSIEYKIRF